MSSAKGRLFRLGLNEIYQPWKQSLLVEAVRREHVPGQRDMQQDMHGTDSHTYHQHWEPPCTYNICYIVASIMQWVEVTQVTWLMKSIYRHRQLLVSYL